jgi:hypothetical protein
MPAHDGVRLDDGKDLGPSAPSPAQQDPENPVRRPDVGMSQLGLGGELLAEGQLLDGPGPGGLVASDRESSPSSGLVPTVGLRSRGPGALLRPAPKRLPEVMIGL